MWNISRQYAVGSRQLSKGRKQIMIDRCDNNSRQTGVRCLLPTAYCLLLFAFCLLLSGCRQDMQDQPRYNALRASATFSDGASARPLVEGTIPRGWLREDELYYTGKMSGAQARTPTGAATTTQATTPNMQGGTSGQPSGNSNTNV